MGYTGDQDSRQLPPSNDVPGMTPLGGATVPWGLYFRIQTRNRERNQVLYSIPVACSCILPVEDLMLGALCYTIGIIMGERVYRI